MVGAERRSGSSENSAATRKFAQAIFAPCAGEHRRKLGVGVSERYLLGAQAMSPVSRNHAPNDRLNKAHARRLATIPNSAAPSMRQILKTTMVTKMPHLTTSRRAAPSHV